MLAGSASSLRQAPAHASANGIPLQPLDSKFAQMAKVFEIASGATKASMHCFCPPLRPACMASHRSQAFGLKSLPTHQ